MNSKDVGDTTEARIVAELVARGLSVSIPCGDNDPYDLVAETADGLSRVQCKTGWIEDGVLRSKTGSRTTTDGEPTVTDSNPGDGTCSRFDAATPATCSWFPSTSVARRTRIPDAPNRRATIPL